MAEASLSSTWKLKSYDPMRIKHRRTMSTSSIPDRSLKNSFVAGLDPG